MGQERTNRAIKLLRERLPKEEFIDGLRMLMFRMKSAPKSEGRAFVRGSR